MARFLCAVWPFPGHLYPMLAVAHALRSRGHEVAFYTGGTARAVVEGEGFVYFPFDHLATRLHGLVGDSAVGQDDDALYERLTARYAPSSHHGGLARLRLVRATYHEWIIGTIPQQVADLTTIIGHWSPDVVVAEPVMWSPFLVLHESQSLPVAILSFLAGCVVPGPDAPFFGLGLPRPSTWYQLLYTRLAASIIRGLTADIRRAPNAVRRRYGLAPLREPVTAFMARMPLHLVTTTPEYDYERRDLPPSVHYVGACLWDKPSHESPPLWLQDMPTDDPIVYVSEGTSHVLDAVLLRMAAKALGGLPLRAILTTGRRREPEAIGLIDVAPNVRVERFVPHSDLFPRLSLVVTNGGSNTVRAALVAGLPLVIVPMEWDQFDNAQRVVDAGAGFSLGVRNCTPRTLRAAVERVLHTPSYRANARRLAATFARYSGPDCAASLLEHLAPGGQSDISAAPATAPQRRAKAPAR